MPTILDLAEKQQVKLPVQNQQDLDSILVLNNTPTNLEEYLKRFEITLSVLQTPESLI